jgi:hypothetical protein
MTLPKRPLPDLPPPSLITAALGAIHAVRRGADALTPPELSLWHHVFGAARTELIGLAARLSLADRINNDPRSAESLAAETDTHPDALHRAMRAMAAFGLFSLREDGRFEHTRMSRALRADGARSLRDAALYWTSDSNLAAWRALERAVRNGEGAFEQAHGQSVWDWFDAHPDERETFARAMGRATALEAPQLASLYPFGALGTLADVGGGSGTLLSEILLRNPTLRGVLCDAPGVLQTARGLLASRGVLDRVELVPGSFFDRVPTGCDGYVMKSILHDWDDARCETILTVVRRSMRAGAKLVLCETILERDDRRPEATMSDLQMLVACGGRERTLSEHRALLERTGFAMGRVFRGAMNSVIEGTAA